MGSEVSLEASLASSSEGAERGFVVLAGTFVTSFARRSFISSSFDCVCCEKSCRASLKLRDMGVTRYLLAP